MTNYNNGKIYKIEPIYGEEGETYIGSTTKQYLSQRMTTHRADYKRWLGGKREKIRCYDLFDKYGLENCNIILLENVNANSKDELISREAYYIKSINCINKLIPNRTKQEYYKENIEIITEKKKQQYECLCGSTFCIYEKVDTKEVKSI